MSATSKDLLLLLTRTLQSLNRLGKQGHIEDVAIAVPYQRRGFGKRIIETLDLLSATLGCYKVKERFSIILQK